MPLEKARNAGISLYPSEIAKLRDLAAISDSGNVPNLIRRIAADGLAAPSAAVAPDIIARLAHHYTPTEARQLAPRLAGIDQAALVARLLREIAECLAAGMAADSLHIAGAHEISAEPVALSALRYPPRLPRSRLATYPDPMPTDPQLNEPPAPIRAPALTAAELAAMAAQVKPSTTPRKR